MEGGLVDSNIRLQHAYSVNDWRLPAPYDRADTGADLIVISLLSLGLWAGIWAVVASLAAAVLG